MNARKVMILPYKRAKKTNQHYMLKKVRIIIHTIKANALRIQNKLKDALI